MIRVRDWSIHALDIPMAEPFGIAGGTQELAKNVFVKLTLDDGTEGWGEAAPFPVVSGETQTAVVHALDSASHLLDGVDVSCYRVAHELLLDRELPPTALCCIETALFDALARRLGTSLFRWFGGAQSRLTTDITIPTGTPVQAASAALRAAEQGFRTLKVKVGPDADEDVRRLRALAAAVPHLRWILDANGSYGSDEALELLRGLGELKARVDLFEQPVAAADLGGLARVQRDGQVLVAADESLRSTDDFRAIVRHGGIGAINIKTSKLGVVRAWDLIVAARCAGLELMVGGMVETELAMTMSACLAGGIGGVRFVDLDTPRFLGPRPLRGGFVESGPHLELDGIHLGHGVHVALHTTVGPPPPTPPRPAGE